MTTLIKSTISTVLLAVVASCDVGSLDATDPATTIPNTSLTAQPVQPRAGAHGSQITDIHIDPSWGLRDGTAREWCGRVGPYFQQSGQRAGASTWDCVDMSGGKSCNDIATGGDYVRCQERGPGDQSVTPTSSAPGQTGAWWCENHFGANLGGIWDCIDSSGGSCASDAPAGGVVTCRQRDMALWMAPSHVTQFTGWDGNGNATFDFASALAPAAFTNQIVDWSATRRKLTGIKTYQQTIEQLYRTNPQALVVLRDKLLEWGLGLSIEIPDSSGYSCDAGRKQLRADDIAMIDVLLANRMPIRELILDSPLWVFVADNGEPVQSGCRISQDQAVADIITYLQTVRGRPNWEHIRIGITDPVPWRVYGNSAPAQAQQLAVAKANYTRWIGRIREAGVSIDFIQFDDPYNFVFNNVMGQAGPGSMDHLVLLEDFFRYELQVEPHIVLNDWNGGIAQTTMADEGKWHTGSNRAFADGVSGMLSSLIGANSRAQGYVVQSWYRHPDIWLPESNPESHTGITLQAARGLQQTQWFWPSP
jgi:hypothetical protein